MCIFSNHKLTIMNNNIFSIIVCCFNSEKYIAKTLDISFEESVIGCEANIRVTSLQICNLCNGSKCQQGTSPSKCPDCSGLGEVKRSHKSFFGQFVQVMICGRCQGKASIVRDKCDKCSGKGTNRSEKDLVVTIRNLQGESLFEKRIAASK